MTLCIWVSYCWGAGYGICRSLPTGLLWRGMENGAGSAASAGACLPSGSGDVAGKAASVGLSMDQFGVPGCESRRSRLEQLGRRSD